MKKLFALISSFALVSAIFFSFAIAVPNQKEPQTNSASQDPSLTQPNISIWEAYAKGNATIQEVNVTFRIGNDWFTEPLGFRVQNFGPDPILINEYVMLLSPHPLVTYPDPDMTTQDGVLTYSVVPPFGSRTYHYAEYVILGWLSEPKWWCVELYEYVQPEIYIMLGGEILPFELANMVVNYNDQTPYDIWNYFEAHPSLVVGKTPLWDELPDLAGTTLDVTLAVTNMGVYDSGVTNGSSVRAVDSLVKDVIPPGYSYDPNSFNVQPYSIVSNPDGSKTLTWKVTIPGADIRNHNRFIYTPYNHVLLRYKLILPELTPGRHYLPRATVDTNHNGTIDAHSAKPLLEIYHVNRPPVANAGGSYTGLEGGTVTFNGMSSYDPDNGPSPLKYRWDLDDDGVWDTSWSSSPYTTYKWGDDYTGKVVLQVTDGNLTDTDKATVTINNVMPSGSVSILSVQEEGNSIQFSAHVTDPGSDDLFLTWSWGDGSPNEYSTYYNNGVSPDPYPSPDIHPRDITDVKSHTYGDNGAYTVKVLIRDDDSMNLTTTLMVTSNPNNLPPSVNVTGGLVIDEGQSVSLTATAIDPGSDDLTFDWDWGEGSSESRTYYNNGVSPDPPNSPGGTWPFTATDPATHAYGDNGLYSITLTVTDDDGGLTTWSGQLTVLNLPPSITQFGPFSIAEGSQISITTDATDPGSDDLTFEWTFELGPTFTNVYYNDGVNPDPPNSPGGTYPFTASDTAMHTYGDNAVYSVKLIVTDDDGASDTWVSQVIVTNLPPTIQPFGPYDVNEADPLSVAATATDPGSDDLTFTWTFDYGPTIQNTYYNDGVSPDPAKSPDGTFPFTAGDFASHTYGDDGVFTIILIVEDDDGDKTAYRTVVTVHNVPPTIVSARAFVVANITMRIAGEKWHDVIMRLYEDGNEIGYARLVRYPGSPNDQMATINGVEINLERQFSVVVYYTPDDDPVNGQPNGANPFWLIFEWEDSGETRLHHTFNVQHPETWIWKVDNVYIHALGHEIHLQGSATDPGSDDLIFVWDTGDGRAFRTIAFNDGVGPDRYPSPDINPMSASSEVTFVYSVAGTYTITLTVIDDDGGSSIYSFTIKIG